jgi:nitrate/nitrite transporter NarK
VPNIIGVVITLVTAIILSIIAIIFTARKSETQSFVSIEDFWGGLLIGFLIGYTGTSFFDNLTNISDLTNATN